MRVMMAWAILMLLLVVQVEAGAFHSLKEVNSANRSSLAFFPSSDINFREWIFPNSFRFACQENVTGWIFRSEEGISDFSDRRLPHWSIYAQSSVSPEAFDLLMVSGSADEIREIEPGLYQYTLSAPVSVKFNDTLGIRYEQNGDPFLRVGFQDMGTGLEEPVSFRRPRVGNFIFDIAASFVTRDTRYVPLISVIVADDNMPTPSTAATSTSTVFMPDTQSVATSTLKFLSSMVQKPSPTKEVTVPSSALHNTATVFGISEVATSSPTHTVSEITGVVVPSSTFHDQDITITVREMSEVIVSSPTPSTNTTITSGSSTTKGLIAAGACGVVIILAVMLLALIIPIAIAKRKALKNAAEAPKQNFDASPNQLYEEIDLPFTATEAKEKDSTDHMMEAYEEVRDPNPLPVATPNQAYGLLGPYQQQDVELQQNQAYAKTPYF